MHNLERIEGKTINDLIENFDGANSYIIMKFDDGGKLNISSYPNGDEGTGQFDIDVAGLKGQGVVGKRIHKIKEEFDGLNDFLTFLFKDGTSLTITAFSSAEEGTAGLSADVYSPENLVKESLDEYVDYTKPDQWHFPLNKDDQGVQNEEYNPNTVIGVIINPQHKMAFMKIIKELKGTYSNVSLDLELGAEAKAPVITIEDETATVENVSDDLYKYIEKGIVYAVDEI